MFQESQQNEPKEEQQTDESNTQDSEVESEPNLVINEGMTQQSTRDESQDSLLRETQNNRSKLRNNRKTSRQIPYYKTVIAMNG